MKFGMVQTACCNDRVLNAWTAMTSYNAALVLVARKLNQRCRTANYDRLNAVLKTANVPRMTSANNANPSWMRRPRLSGSCRDATCACLAFTLPSPPPVHDMLFHAHYKLKRNILHEREEEESNAYRRGGKRQAAAAAGWAKKNTCSRADIYTMTWRKKIWKEGKRRKSLRCWHPSCL